MKGFAGLLFAFVLGLGLVVALNEPVQADTFPFGLGLVGALDFKYVGTDSDGLSIYRSEGNIYPITNGKVDPSAKWGNAYVIVWNRTVADPFFGPLGPIAVLIKLYFAPPLSLQVNLSLIQTPSGLQTTVGVVGNQSIRGNWTFADGTLFGGTAKDLVVGGLLVVGTPSPPFQANLNVPINQYFPSFPYSFHSDLFPNCEHGVLSAGYSFSSFYGFTTIFGQAMPVRSYTLDVGGLASGHLTALQVGGDGYFLVSCGKISYAGSLCGSSSSKLDLTDCTLSGTSQLAPYTGDAVYLPSNVVGEIFLSLFNWYLVMQ